MPNRLPLMIRIVALLVATGLAVPASAGVWTESSDAGNRPSSDGLGESAQITSGIGAISTISGTFDNSSLFFEDIDLFKIKIDDPGSFSASVFGTDPLAVADTFLFLFDANGFGVAADNDSAAIGDAFVNMVVPSATTIARSELTAGAISGLSAGDYFIGLSTGFALNFGLPFPAGDLPVNANGDLIFDLAADYLDGKSLFAPGPGGVVLPSAADNQFAGWQFNGSNDGSLDTAYEIRLTGTSFAQVPEPASLAVWSTLAIGLISFRCRRRRRI